MRRIGVIDSGVGGLSILRHLLEMQRDCEFFYQSDHSNVPYGGKEQSFMLAHTARMVEKLLDQNVELIILACNTLTAETIDVLRKSYQIPFVGIEPFVNFINTDFYNEGEKVGLILTPATSKSERFKALKGRLDPQNKIHVYPLPRLALIIEEMASTGIEKNVLDLEGELEALKSEGLNVLLYGCTHYPLLSKRISSYLGVKVYDPHIAVSKRVIEVLGLKPSKTPDFKSTVFHYAPEVSCDWEDKTLSSFEFFSCNEI